MKKLFISLMLLLLVVPSVFVMSACGKDNGYQLANLKTDFNNIAEKYQNVKLDGNKLVFDYSAFVYNDDKYLETLINTTKPYTELQAYTTIFDNVMMFANQHIEICSNNSIDIDEESRNLLKSKLDEFDLAVGDVNIYINKGFTYEQIIDRVLDKQK